MDFFDVLNQRHSIRAYQPQPVAQELLQRILDAMNRAPSAGNLQAWFDAGYRIFNVLISSYPTSPP